MTAPHRPRRKPSTTARDKKLVWHYTSLSALIPILQNNSLIATEVAFQNDPYEEYSALNAMSSLLDRAGEASGVERFSSQALATFEVLQERSAYDANADRLLAASRFIVCASVNGDSLYAWRTYGSVGSIGCAIGLDRSKPLGVINSPNTVEATSWQNVIYSEKELDATLLPQFVDLATRWKAATEDEHVDSAQLLLTGLDTLWSEVRACAKHASYRDEEEARVTIITPKKQSVGFRDGKFGPRPHVLLGAADNWGEPSTGTAPLPIRSIRLGPDAPDAAIQSVQWLLATNGYVIDAEYELDEYVDDFGYLQQSGSWNSAQVVDIERSIHAYRDV